MWAAVPPDRERPFIHKFANATGDYTAKARQEHTKYKKRYQHTSKLTMT
jgi:hypothetical protein